MTIVMLTESYWLKRLKLEILVHILIRNCNYVFRYLECPNCAKRLQKGVEEEFKIEITNK
jgi:hypothetical protein